MPVANTQFTQADEAREPGAHDCVAHRLIGISNEGPDEFFTAPRTARKVVHFHYLELADGHRVEAQVAR